jgi:hypothetical protein
MGWAVDYLRKNLIAGLASLLVSWYGWSYISIGLALAQC